MMYNAFTLWISCDAVTRCVQLLQVISTGFTQLHWVLLISTSRHSRVFVVFAAISAGAWAIPAAVSHDELFDGGTNSKLELFCEAGLLRDRGVAIPILAGSSDFLIMEYLAQEDSFCSAVGVSKETFVTARKDRPESRSMKRRAEFVPPSQFTDSDSACVRSLIPPDDVACIYFQLEGLMALCRPEIAKLISLSEEDRQKILEKVKTTLDEEVYPVNQKQFTLTNDSAIYEYHYRLVLRKVSVQLDHQILRILNVKERESLLKIIRDSLRFGQIVEDPCRCGLKKK
ncbi:MAG: hypothetical protein R3C59_10670 [Planctomycetaceae bacterium]